MLSEYSNESLDDKQGSLVSVQTEGDSDSDDELLDIFTITDGVVFQHKPELIEKWKQKTDTEIIEEALKSGNISVAFTFIKLRAEEGGNVQYNFESFKKAAFRLIYSYFLNEEYETAVQMIKNLGEDVLHQMKQIAFATTSSKLRNHLITQLKIHKKLNEQDLKLVEFLQTLEQYYSTQSFRDAFQNYLSKHRYTNIHLDTTQDGVFMSGEIDDYGEFISTTETIQKSPKRIQSLRFNKPISLIPQTTLTPKQEVTKSSEKYLYVSLAWIQKWDEDTKERILIEMAKSISNRSLESKLRYHVSHHDVFGVLLWVKSLPKDLCKAQTESNKDLKTVYSITSEQLNYCSPFLQEVFLNALAKRGIFLETSQFKSLMKRFAKSGQLLTKKSMESFLVPLGEKETVDATLLLPVGKVADFHTKFVQFAIDNHLLGLFEKYMDTFQLWKCNVLFYYYCIYCHR